MRSKVSRVFIGMSVISLLLSYINGRDYRLLIFELLSYIVLAMTVNCMIYGNCKLSSILILLFPVSLVVVNILNMAGIQIGIPKETKMFTTYNSLKTDEEKRQYIGKLERKLEKGVDGVTS